MSVRLKTELRLPDDDRGRLKTELRLPDDDRGRLKTELRLPDDDYDYDHDYVRSREGKLRALSRARAVFDAADMDIDREITAFESALLIQVGKDRRSGPYRKIFPNGLTAVTRTRSALQLRQLRTIEDAIRREFPDAAWAQEALTKITAAREEYERQVAALRRAEEDLAATRAAERAARVDATRQLRYTYAELLKVYAHTPRQAGTFFPRITRSTKSTDPSEPPEDVVVTPATDAPAPTP